MKSRWHTNNPSTRLLDEEERAGATKRGRTAAAMSIMKAEESSEARQ
jgi:hypothetical protein